jgi:phosphoglycolate phosphatase-like HAD superfamily hydrolase
VAADLPAPPARDDRAMQFGAATVITKATKVLMMDCFETLVAYQDGAYVARLGVTEFLDHHCGRRQLPLAVVSDATEAAVVGALRQAGLWTRVDQCFHAGNAQEVAGDGRTSKRLDAVLRFYGVPAAEAVFIGDSPLDARDAQRYQVPFIRVPRSEDRSFSFATLIQGPSLYTSGHFSSLMLQQYLNPKP